MWTSGRLLLNAPRIRLGQREGTIRLGQSKLRVVSAVVVEKHVYDEVLARERGIKGTQILGLQRDQRELPRLRARVYQENLFAPVDETRMCNGFSRIIERR